MRQTIIAAVTLLLLGAGVAIYLQQRPGPAHDSPRRASIGELCPEHGVPESRCPFCRPSLVEELGECREHGVPEALCVTCNPDLESAFRAEGDWCGGHGVPESQCVQCGHDPRNPGAPTTVSVPTATSDLTVEAAETPRDLRSPSVSCDSEDLVVRLRAAEVARVIGIELERIESRPARSVLTANAEIDFDRSRYARLASFAPGVIREMKRDFGDTVLAGGIVAVIDSRELGEAKADLLSAVALVTLREQNHAREQELARKGISAEKDLLEAKTALTESRVAADRARQRLRNLGLADAAIERVVADRDTSSLLPLTATFGGTVVERNGAPGEIADTSLPLYTIADLDRMWALLDVSESEAVRLRPGLPVKFSSDGLAGRFFAGKITWVGAEVDRHTRMVRARAVLENAGGALRANMFGKAVVILGEGTESPAVPRDAVQWDGCCNIVFVAEGEARYRPRKVVLGANLGRFYEVLDGLEAGETVVTTGSFLLKTEILKDSIGAGCCEVNPGGE